MTQGKLGSKLKMRGHMHTVLSLSRLSTLCRIVATKRYIDLQWWPIFPEVPALVFPSPLFPSFSYSSSTATPQSFNSYTVGGSLSGKSTAATHTDVQRNNALHIHLHRSTRLSCVAWTNRDFNSSCWSPATGPFFSSTPSATSCVG